MYCHDPAARRLARRQNMFEHVNLVRPVLSMIWTAIEADLTNIPAIGKQIIKESEFGLPLVGQLGMQSKCRADSRCAGSESRRLFPCAGRCGNRKQVDALFRAAFDDLLRILVQIQMAVKVDHRTPWAFRNLPSSSIPRL